MNKTCRQLKGSLNTIQDINVIKIIPRPFQIISATAKFMFFKAIENKKNESVYKQQPGKANSAFVQPQEALIKPVAIISQLTAESKNK